MDENRLKQDIIEVGKRLFYKGFVASNDGNISIRISENEILITPTGVSKGYMTVEDMIKVNLSGEVVSGSRKPSSEMKMHLAVYKKRADVKAIVHAHPQKATAFAVANKGFDRITLPEVVFSLGVISLAEYGTPTTYQLPESVERHIGNSDALLLANHGALTVGNDIFDAYYKMETLEHFAAISLYARLLGGEKALDEKQTEELFRVRTEVYGKPNPLCTGCGACGNCKSKEEKKDSSPDSDGDIRKLIKAMVLKELQKLNM